MEQVKDRQSILRESMFGDKETDVDQQLRRARLREIMFGNPTMQEIPGTNGGPGVFDVLAHDIKTDKVSGRNLGLAAATGAVQMVGDTARGGLLQAQAFMDDPNPGDREQARLRSIANAGGGSSFPTPQFGTEVVTLADRYRGTVEKMKKRGDALPKIRVEVPEKEEYPGVPEINTELADLSKVEKYQQDQGQRTVLIDPFAVARDSLSKVIDGIESPKDITPERVNRPLMNYAVAIQVGTEELVKQIGYVPSQGIVSGTLEGAAQSVPHFLAGITLSAGASAVGGPTAGAMVSGAYFGATEGFTHTADVYDRMIEQGVDEREARLAASNSGLIYGTVSSLLESYGVSKILKGTRFGDDLVRAATKPTLLQKAANAAGAGMVEGQTELAQGVLSEALTSYAVEDWDGFKEKYTKSDEPFKEFASAFLLGGGVRAVIDVTSPSQYKSLEEWKQANQPKSADRKLEDAPSDRADQDDGEAGGLEADVQPTVDQGDAAQDQGEQANDNAGGDDVLEPIIAGDQERAPEGDQAGENDPVRGAVDDSVVRVQEEAPISEPAMRRFTEANQTEVRTVEPRTRAQRRAVSFMGERGVPVRLVESVDGSPLRVPAMWTADGVVLDANAGSDEQTRALVYHEAFHDLKRRNPDAWEKAYQSVRELDPEGLSRAERQYFADAQAAGVDVQGADAADEAVARYAEGVVGWLESARNDPAKMRAIAEKNPGVFRRVLDAIQRAARSIGAWRGETTLERGGAKVTAARLAREMNSALDTLVGTKPGEVLSNQSAPTEQSTVSRAHGAGERVTFPRKRKPGEYSKRDIRRKMQAMASEYGFSSSDGLVLNESERAEIADEMPDFSFGSEKLPDELVDALKTQPPAVRQLFQTNQKNAHGEETLLTLGADEMIRRARSVALTGEMGMGELFRSNMSGDPVADVLILLDDLYGQQLREVQPKIEVQENPEQLPDGATFEIAGDEFVVYSDDQGQKRFTNGSRDLSLIVPELPMDANTLNRNAGATREDVEIDLPFAVAPPEDSRAFRKWFGDSKVVDENGKPLVVYHGTNADFTVFDPDQYGSNIYPPLGAPKGVYFTHDAALASRYAKSDGGAVLPVYLRIENPAPDADTFNRESQYDGFINSKIAVVRNPEQVKSVNNSGTFDPNNPDIRFAVQGDEKAISLMDRLPDPPKPSRGLRKFFERNSTEGMFDGINPNPRVGFSLMLDHFRRSIQDKFLPVLRVQEAVEQAGGRVSPEANAYRAETLYYGKAAEAKRRYDKWIVEPLLKKMKDAGIDRGELDLYLYAKHAPERNRVIADRNPDFDGPGSGMSDEDAAAIVERFESSDRGESFKSLLDEVAKIREWNLNYMVENDLLSREQADAWRETYENYVPLRTADQGTSPVPRISRGFDVRGPESKQAEGRRSLADSPLLFLLHQGDQAIVRAERNRVALSMMRMIIDNPEPTLWNVYRPTHPVKGEPDLWGNTEVDIERNPGVGQARNDPNTIIAKYKGDERYLNIQNEDLVRALKNMGTGHMPKALRLLSKLMRFRAATLTTLSPEFVVSNFVRDAQTAGINISADDTAGVAASVLKNAGPALKGAYSAIRGERAGNESKGGKWGQLYREFVEDGGKTGWTGAYSFEDRVREIEKLARTVDSRDSAAKRMAGSVLGLVPDINSAVENSLRLSYYAELRNKGVERSKAAEAAKNLTVNFNRSGEASPWLNSLYLFFNASVQGTTRMLQAAKTPTGRKIMGGMTTLAFGLAFANAFLSDEDEDGELYYDKISPWERSHNLILMIPNSDGRYIKVPLPYGYNVFHAIGTHAASAVRGKETTPEALGHIASSALNSFNPIGGSDFRFSALVPEFAKPLAEISENENFMGRPINPTRFPGQTDPNSQMYFNSTGKGAKWIAEKLNSLTGGDEVMPGAIDVSPGTIDHWIDFLGGSAGRFVKEALVDLPAKAMGDGEFTARSTPFVRRFAGEPYEGRHRSEFWRNNDEMMSVRNYERAYLKSDDPDRVEQYRENQGVMLEAAWLMDVYKRAIDSQLERLENGDVSEDEIDSLYAEANRMARRAHRGRLIETPVLDSVRGVTGIKAQVRKNRMRAERDARRNR